MASVSGAGVLVAAGVLTTAGTVSRAAAAALTAGATLTTDAVLGVVAGGTMVGDSALTVGATLIVRGCLANPIPASDTDTFSVDFARATYAATDPGPVAAAPLTPSIWYKFTESQVADWVGSTSGFANGAFLEIYAGTPDSLTLVAADVGPAPVLTASAPPLTAEPGVAYSYTFTANGTPAPTFSVTAGVLPAGLSLTTGGVLAGTPTTVGNSTFTVAAHNTTAPDATVTVTVVVAVVMTPVTTGGGSIYGPGIGYDSKANVNIGPAGQKMAVRFRASTSSTVQSVRWVQRGGPSHGGGAYSYGDGGTTTVSIQADDGAGHPSGVSLASTSVTTGNPATNWETYIPMLFSTPPALTAGSLYYIVFTNPDTVNNISVNNVWNFGNPVPREPRFPDTDYGLMYTTGAWGALEGGYTPIIDVAYANGVHDGQGYYEAMIDKYATINGASMMAREHFTVTGGSRTVGSVSVRLRRSSGTSSLVITLETAAGATVEAVTVPASSVPVTAPGGADGGAVWVAANFAAPHVLANGAGYNLRLSTASDTIYTTFPIRSGRVDGFESFTFADGTGQATTDGSTWADLYAYDHQDLQCYFTLTT